jgi:hypothetical protein
VIESSISTTPRASARASARPESSRRGLPRASRRIAI